MYYAGQRVAGNNPYKNVDNKFLKLRLELKIKEEKAKKLHYQRNNYNYIPQGISLENIENYGRKRMWADKYHQDGVIKGYENSKWVSDDGKNEVVFSYDGKIITDVNNMGTYNFYAGGGFDTIDHFKYDVSPWKEWGSGPNDTNSLR